MSTRFTALAAALLCCHAAPAGPPMICHAIDIGNAPSLPLQSGAVAVERLPAETLAILEGTDDALVHMETLRRAAISTDKDRDLATTMMATLMARALDAEAVGRPDALAWFDAGYLAQCYHQLGLRLQPECGSAGKIVGYAWVRRAVELSPDDAGLQFGAAMVTALYRTRQHDEHTARARALADAGSAVARNLEHHASNFWHYR